jgi:hypothetical protein
MAENESILVIQSFWPYNLMLFKIKISYPCPNPVENQVLNVANNLLLIIKTTESRS